MPYQIQHGSGLCNNLKVKILFFIRLTNMLIKHVGIVIITVTNLIIMFK